MRDAAQFFKVLADEARLRMLWLLFNHQELCVCDLMEALEITQSKASRHLRTLHHAGLVSDRKDGLWSYYSLRPVEDELSKRHLAVLRVTLGNRADATELLAKLHRWLQANQRDVVCSKGSMCAGSAGRRAAR
jgi:ArsR family transcriptional regulator, arsenate/arsenite/antimonite-responsive transcriptional repressor